LYGLEIADRVPELLALVSVGIGPLESRFRDPDGERRDPDTSAIEDGQSLFAAATAFA
jgi:hypothetical protein